MSNQTLIADAELGTDRKLIKSYLIGFFLSVILAVAAFAIVEQHILTGESLYFALAAFALAQLFVQVVFFLRLNANTEDDKWNLISFLFTILIIMIVVTGSLWIMYNLNYFMMH